MVALSQLMEGARCMLKSSLVKIVLATCLFLTIPLSNLYAKNLQGRLGLGMTNQFIHNVPALSIKIQRSPAWAMGLLSGFRFSDTDGGWGIGAKVYRIFFDEPQLNFYGTGTAAFLKDERGTTSDTGYQFDAALGSEFHFSGLSSLGFSFEFGLSFNKLWGDFVVETTANNFIVAAVHFYL